MEISMTGMGYLSGMRSFYHTVLMLDKEANRVTNIKLSNVFHHSSGHPSHPATPPAPRRVFVPKQ
jgi:hypothetical protein